MRNSEGCLERLRLSHAVALTAAATTAIAMFCPLLTHLYLLGCTGLQSPILDARVAATLDVQVGRDRDGGVLPDPVSSLGTGWGVAGLMRRLDREGLRASLPQEGESGAGADPDIHVRDAGAEKPPRPRWQRLRVLDLTGCAGVWERDVMGLIEGCIDLQVRACARLLAFAILRARARVRACARSRAALRPSPSPPLSCSRRTCASVACTT